MIRIYKYPAPITDHFSASVPSGAEPLYVDVQNGSTYLWMRVDTQNPLTLRQFACYGTGHDVDPLDIYVGTLQQPPFVWHLFEKKP